MQDFLLYLQLGWEHIISTDAIDHQLFLVALVVIFSFKDLKKLLILITAFTIGHSITLVLSVLEILSIPSDWIEFLIPLTIAITAFDNIFKRNNPEKLMKTNYILALFFGMIHGMGFANIARMTITDDQSLLVPLLGFNIGLEIGQLLVVFVIFVVTYLLSLMKINKKKQVILLSALVLLWSILLLIQRFPR